MAENDMRGAGLNLWIDTAERALLASVSPVAESLPIDEAWLRERIAALGAAGMRYLPSAATILLSKYNAGSAVAALRIAECVDASLALTISADAMTATLDIVPAQGGNPVSKEAILRALGEKGIAEGIDLDVINGAIAVGAAHGAIIARGRPPVHGDDGYFESVIPEARDRRPRVDESGRIDYRDLGEIVVVHKGDPLVRRHPATAGTPGRNLLGEAIPATPGKDIMFAANLSGAAVLSDDPNLLLAEITGQPVQVNGGAIVEPVFSVADVGTASGNIDFDGSVVIKGDVAAGMTVRATGDIQVGGMVEAATLDAGGSIVIKGGVVGSLGRKEDAGYHIRCGGSFNAAYTQQARIEAGDSIFIDDTAMQSELIAASHIIVGNKRRGHIIGGRLQALLSIKGKHLGSPNRVVTRFDIGVDPAIQRRAHDLGKARDEKETQLLEVSKLLDFAAHHPERIRPEMLEKARATAAALGDAIAGIREEEQALDKTIALAMQAAVIGEEAILEGVEVYFGSQRYRVAGEHGPGAISLGKGGLGLRAIDEVPAA